MAMILLLTVRATSIDKKAPTRFKMADNATSASGFRLPWQPRSPSRWPCHESPLVKSNASAVTTTMHKMNAASVTGHRARPRTWQSTPYVHRQPRSC